jgi:pimeloyl-ACP methyl ester carboxylesterase
MKTKITATIFTVLFLSIQLVTSGQAQIGKFIESVDCPFNLPDGLVIGKNFKFGYVEVPEFYAQKNGKTIQLAVAVFPCTNPDNAQEPLVMNTSGPGKSNMDNFIPQITGGLGNYILPNRDVVIIELRGLRYSSSFLRCEEVFHANIEMLEENPSFQQSTYRLRSAINETKERFENNGINLSAYNNTETAKDIHMVMNALGYNQFSLVGSSAGSLVAHHVINENPERIRCAILDAGLPVEPSLLINYVPSIINCLKNYFEECRSDSLFNKAFPDLEQRFLELIDKLNKNPEEITVINPESNEEVRVLINGYRLAEHILFNMFYSTQIPLLIGNLVDGDYSSLKDFASGKMNPNYFADGLGYTVFINEAGNYSNNDIAIDSKYQTFANGIFLSGLGGRYLLEVQKQWKLDFARSENEFGNEPHDTPVLVLNGKYDPVIPVNYDIILKEKYPNSHIYRFDGVPHSAFDNATSCVLPMVLEFLNNPDKAPNSDCMHDYKQIYKIK